MTMPALPAATLVVTRAQQLLAFPDAGLDGPAYAGQDGCPRRGHGRGTPGPARYRDSDATPARPRGLTDHSGGDPAPDGKVGVRGAAAVPYHPVPGPGIRGPTVPQSPVPPGCQPEPRVSGHLRYVAQARRGHPVQEVDRPSTALGAAPRALAANRRPPAQAASPRPG